MRQQLEKALRDTRTPGLSVAIVHRDGPDGGLTEMWYMPDGGVGYFYSINSGSRDADEWIGKIIRVYITRQLPKTPLPALAALPANAAEYAGWYVLDLPRMQMAHFLTRLIGAVYVRFQDGKLLVSDPGELHKEFLPVAGAQFRYVPRKDPPQPIPTVACSVQMPRAGLLSAAVE